MLYQFAVQIHVILYHPIYVFGVSFNFLVQQQHHMSEIICCV